MPIEFHCPACEKQIRAPDAAGGKHGKCPYCDAKVYIPTPYKDDELIPLAPDDIDENEEHRLREEAARYAALMDKDADAQASPPEGRESAKRGAAAQPGEVIDQGDLVKQFILAMKDSKLDEAERITGRLRRAGTRSRDYVEGMLLDPTPMPIEGVSKPLVQGFLRTLLERLQ